MSTPKLKKSKIFNLGEGTRKGAISFGEAFEATVTVFEGKAPESVTLTKVLYGFPDNWQEQRKLLGIA